MILIANDTNFVHGSVTRYVKSPAGRLAAPTRAAAPVTPARSRLEPRPALLAPRRGRGPAPQKPGVRAQRAPSRGQAGAGEWWDHVGHDVGRGRGGAWTGCGLRYASLRARRGGAGS